MSQFDQSPDLPHPPPTGTSPTDRPPDHEQRGPQPGTIAHITPLVLMLPAAACHFSARSWSTSTPGPRPGGPAYAATALNVQIMVAIASAASYVLMFVLVGFLTLPIVLVVGIIAHVLGALKANKGERFEPPLTPTFVN